MRNERDEQPVKDELMNTPPDPSYLHIKSLLRGQVSDRRIVLQ